MSGIEKRSLDCPLLVMADSYKAGHFKMYPPAKSMVAYGEFRQSFAKMDDQRIVVYGMRYYIEQFVSRLVTSSDIKHSAEFYNTHGIGHSAYPFPRGMFDSILNENGGHLPVKIEALPEGSVVYPHTPVFIITAEENCVATLSRHSKTLIQEAFEKSVDRENFKLVDSRLHDFGFRGCTCVEQSVLGGSAHLLNFDGSDTMSAGYYVQYHLNGGNPVATSIPATEHSVMTSWASEIEAILNLIVQHPGQMIACVMDSYDYDNALNNILPKVKDAVVESGCTLILRPDSGDPVMQVVKALKAAEAAGFTCKPNGKKFKVLSNVGVLQGDGIDYQVIKDILLAVMNEGYSAQNVAFGMGGGLLQKVNRDTMSFATKLSFIEYNMDGCAARRQQLKTSLNGLGCAAAADAIGSVSQAVSKEIMKAPATDIEKFSLPGRLMVLRQQYNATTLGPHMVYPADIGAGLVSKGTHVNSMVTVYDNGKPLTNRWETFAEIRTRVETQWQATPSKGVAKDYTMVRKQEAIGRSIKDGLKATHLDSRGYFGHSELESPEDQLLGTGHEAARERIHAGSDDIDDLLRRHRQDREKTDRIHKELEDLRKELKKFSFMRDDS